MHAPRGVSVSFLCLPPVPQEGKESDRLAYDDHSASIFRLSNGTVLYLRQVGRWAVVLGIVSKVFVHPVSKSNRNNESSMCSTY